MTPAAVIAGDAQWCVLCADNRDVLPTLPDRCVEHVITDPPYSDLVHKSVRSSGRNNMADRAEFGCRTRRCVDLTFGHLGAPLRRHVARESARIATRWVMAFSDVESCWLWRISLEAAGLDYVRTCEWRRLNGAPQFTGDRPASSFEAITLAHPRGRKRWNGGGKQGCYEFPIVLNRGGKNPREHTTQKPLDLMLALVADFSDPGDIILDPFCGSGTTLVAALRLGRRCIGIEREAKWAELSRDRCAAEAASSTLQAARAGQLPLFGQVRP